MENKYLAFDPDEVLNDNDLETSLEYASDKNPAKEAKVVELSQKSGLSRDVVSRNSDKINKYLKFDPDEILKNSPTTAEFLSDPDNAVQAHDDTESLQALEKAVYFEKDIKSSIVSGAVKTAGSTLKGAGETYGVVTRTLDRALSKALPDEVMNFLREPILPWWLNPEEILKRPGITLKSAGESIGAPAERRNFGTDVAEGIGQMGAQIAGLMINPAVGGTALFAQGVDQQAEGIEARYRELNPKGLEFVDRYLMPERFPVIENADGSVSTHRMAAEVDENGNWYAFPTIIRQPDGKLKQFNDNREAMKYALESGEYIEFENKEDALRYAEGGYKENWGRLSDTDTALMLGGAITTIAEKTGLDLLLNRVPPAIKNKVLRQITDIALAGGIEALEEVVEGIGHSLVEMATYNPDAEIFQGLDREASVAGATGAIVRGVINAMVPGKQRVAGTRSERVLAEISDLSGESKLKKTNPEAFKAFMKRLGENSGVDTVYLDPEGAEVFFQNLSEEDLKNPAVKQIMDDIPFAREEGRDIQVPIEIYANDIAGTAVDSGLMPHMRIDPEALTPAQMQSSDVQKEVQNLMEMDREQRESEAEVYNDILGQLIGIGENRSVAEQYAILYEAFFRTKAPRAGKTPLELYEQYGLRVRREVPAELRERAKKIDDVDIYLDRLRSGDFPKTEDIFGKSITQFIKSEGGLTDDGGELSARDAKSLVKEGGRSLDDMAERLVEEGYIKERDPNLVLDAINREMLGQKVYPPGAENQELMTVRQRLSELEGILEESGLDINKLSNDDIRKALLGEVPPPAAEPSPPPGEAAAVGTPSKKEMKARLQRQERRTETKTTDEDKRKADRRRDAERREKISAMPLEEQYKAIYTNELTGLKNRRAFEEDVDKSPVVASIDVDSLKAVNDNLGQNAGDAMLKEVALALDSVGNAYHISGDEFYVLGDSKTDVEKALKSAQEALRGVQVTSEKGTLEGLGFSYGVAESKSKADSAMKENKKARESSGERAARGEFPKGLSLSFMQDTGPGTPGWERAKAKGLDMSEEARMQRAKDMGYDIDFRLTHSGREFNEIRKTGLFDGVFASAGDSSKYGGGDVETTFVTKRPWASSGDVDLDYEKSMETLKREYPGQSDDFYNELYEWTAEDNSNPWDNNILEDFGFDDPGEASWEAQRLRGRIAADQGFDAIAMDDELGVSYLIPSGSQARSINAAFDPDFADSPYLLAQGDKKPRGYFNPKTNEITLTPNANLSTFLHESGHFFLEVMRDLAPLDQSVQADLKILEKWWSDTGAKSEVDKQERFASGFEAYLMEGKAPTPELQPIFTRFKSWLALVYQRIKDAFTANNMKGVELSDEVRSVMDRLLATDEAIKRANIEVFGPTEAEALGLSPEEAAEYQEKINAARDEADTNLTAQIMKELQREREKWWRDGVNDLKEVVRSEINQRPEYEARDFLSGDRVPEGISPVKLDQNHIRQIYGKSPAARLRNMTSSDGVHPDQVAPMFGYRSGDELVKALLNTVNKSKREQMITQEAEARMRQEHGDMLTDGTLDQKARAVVHNEKQAELLLAEMRWLNRAAGNPETPRQYFKAAAELAVNEMPVSQIRPDIHRRNEIKARSEAVKAAAKKDFKKAALEQHKALRQFYLYRESLKAKQNAEKYRNRMKQIAKVKYSSRKVDPDYIQQVKVLLSAYDLRKTPKDSELLLGRVRRFIEAQKASNDDLIADSLLDSVKSWKDMTVNELRAVRDAAENLLTIGKKNSQEAQELYRQEVAEAVASIGKYRGKPKPLERNRSLVTRAKKGFAQFRVSHRKLESLLQELDGWNDNGVLQQKIFRPLWDAQIAEVQRGKTEHEALFELFDGFEYLFSSFKDSLQDLESTKKFVDTHEMPVGKKRAALSLSRAERIVLALNYGNEGNREALRTGNRMEMTDENIMKAISTLTKDELELVNRIWEYVDKFYPELAKVEQKATGIAPQKVEASPFIVNGVQMRGGYYPLQADSSISFNAEMKALEERAKKLMQGGKVRASTKHGSTIERVGFGRQPVNLSIDGLFKHVDGVIHDITHREAVREVDRLLRHPDVRESIVDSIGQEGHKSIVDAVTRLAGGSMHPSDLAVFDKAMRFSRVAVSYGAMGYSVGTALLNVTGFMPAIPEVGKRRLMYSFLKEMANPIEMGKDIKSRSIFMDNRAETINRDVRAILRDMKGNKGWNSFKAHAFWMIQKVDGFITRAVWDAAYNKAIESGADDSQAVFDADRTVSRTQGTGLKIDLSAIEDQSEVYRALSPMYTYFNAILNLSKRQTGKLKTGQIGKLKYMENMFWIFIATAMMEEFLRGAADDDEPEETVARYGKATASYYLGQWFGIRELSGFVRYGKMFETPLQRVAVAPFKALDEYMDLAFDPDKEFDKSTIRAAANLLPIIGFPTGVQVNRTFGYLLGLEESGEDLSLYKMLVTGREENTDIERAFGAED